MAGASPSPGQLLLDELPSARVDPLRKREAIQMVREGT
jgi:hypothetical protein